MYVCRINLLLSQTDQKNGTLGLLRSLCGMWWVSLQFGGWICEFSGSGKGMYDSLVLLSKSRASPCKRGVWTHFSKTLKPKQYVLNPLMRYVMNLLQAPVQELAVENSMCTDTFAGESIRDRTSWTRWLRRWAFFITGSPRTPDYIVSHGNRFLSSGGGNQ